MRVEPLDPPERALAWARPKRPTDAAWQNILVACGEPLRRRMGGVGTNWLTLVFGLCDGDHQQPGERVLDRKPCRVDRNPDQTSVEA